MIPHHARLMTMCNGISSASMLAVVAMGGNLNAFQNWTQAFGTQKNLPLWLCRHQNPCPSVIMLGMASWQDLPPMQLCHLKPVASMCSCMAILWLAGWKTEK